MNSCNVHGSSVLFGRKGASGVPVNSFRSIKANSSNGGCWGSGLLVYEDTLRNSFQRAGFAKYFRSKVASRCLHSFRCNLRIWKLKDLRVALSCTCFLLCRRLRNRSDGTNLNLWCTHVAEATAADIKTRSAASKVSVSCSPILVSSKVWKAEGSPFSSIIGFHPFNNCCLHGCVWGNIQWTQRWSLSMGMQ